MDQLIRGFKLLVQQTQNVVVSLFTRIAALEVAVKKVTETVEEELAEELHVIADAQETFYIGYAHRVSDLERRIGINSVLERRVVRAESKIAELQAEVHRLKCREGGTGSY